METRSPLQRRRSPRRALWRGLALLVLGGVLGGALVTYGPVSRTTAASSTPPPTRTAPVPRTTTKTTTPSLTGSAALVDRLTEQAINAVSPSVVKVENVGTGLGSGVILRRDGYIVTNNHVVAGARQLAVTLASGSTLEGTLVGTDPVDDLAVIKVASKNLPAARLGNSSALRVGQSVLAIGNPLGITSTVTEGIVSALNRTVSEGKGGGSILNAVQTSAPINPGNSGGALITLDGQVVGIPTLVAVDREFGMPANGVGFAIPSNTVQRITSQLIRSGTVTHTARAALGVYTGDVTPDLAAQYGLAADRGVLVARLTPGGPAEKSGLRPGDIIIAIAKTPVRTGGDLLDVLGREKPGDRVTVTIMTPRGERQSVAVTLGELPAGSTG